MKQAQVLIVLISGLVTLNVFAVQTQAKGSLAGPKTFSAAFCSVSDSLPSLQDNGKDIVKTPPDYSCAIASDELAGMASSPATIIDTRSKRFFDVFHIDSAMNLSPSELAAKSYLKNQIVVLVGSGKDDQSLYSACAWLKDKGFKKTRVLRGGMTSWIAATLPGVGAPQSAENAAKLDDQELFLHGQQPSAMTFLLKGSESFRSYLPNAVALKDTSDTEIKQALKKRKQIPISVALVGSPVLLHEAVVRIGNQGTLGKTAVLTYDRPLADFEQFKKTHEAMSKGPKKASKSSCAL